MTEITINITAGPEGDYVTTSDLEKALHEEELRKARELCRRQE